MKDNSSLQPCSPRLCSWDPDTLAILANKTLEEWSVETRHAENDHTAFCFSGLKINSRDFGSQGLAVPDVSQNSNTFPPNLSQLHHSQHNCLL